jgi:uncharacterized protein YecE (DUF72 family)
MVKVLFPNIYYVEIDSSFYRIPNEFMVKNWVKKTPDNFRFTAKFPKVITHDKHLVDIDEEVDLFLNNLESLSEKTLALLIQLPPSMEIMPGLEGLRNLIPLLDRRFRYAVEVRHHSWFQDLAYNFYVLLCWLITRIPSYAAFAFPFSVITSRV